MIADAKENRLPLTTQFIVIVWLTVLVFFWMKKMQIGIKNHLKSLFRVSRATLRRRDRAGTDYRGTIGRFTKKKKDRS